MVISILRFAHAACSRASPTQHRCARPRTQELLMFNTLRTFVLLAGLTALFMVVGYFISGSGGMMCALVFDLATNLLSYCNADKLELRMQKAVPTDRTRRSELDQ